jgi:hypothetical protein
MIRALLFLSLTFCHLAATDDLLPPPEPANITLTATRAWRLYESRLATDRIQSARLCKLEVKNRSGKPILIRQLRLRWESSNDRAPTPRKLHASIYKIKHDDEAIPDEEQFLASGTWNPKERVLTFAFTADEPLKVTAVHNYYVMVKFDQADLSTVTNSKVTYDADLPLVTQNNTP